MTISFLGDDNFKYTKKEAGAKAFNLHLLKLQNFNVPQGFVLEKNNLNPNLLKNAIEKIGGFPVAIRSSGSLEDLKEASFAGLYKTYLNISDIDTALSSIQLCFESIHSKEVSTYLKSKNITLSQNELDSSMKVLVQKMIEPKYSGVIFGVDPMSGKEEITIIECVFGLGERLVSGTITPTRYKYQNQEDKIIEEIIGVDKVILSENFAKDLSIKTQQIQSYFEHPQDIEWCTDNNDVLWILQSRPITSIKWRNDVDELTNADLKDGGISARSCTPLMYSLYELVMNDSMTKYFQKISLLSKNENPKWIHYFYARGYWNASIVKKCLFKIPGFDEKKFDHDLGIQKDYGSLGPIKVGLSLKSLWAAIPVLINLNREFKDSLVMSKSFQIEFEAQDLIYKSFLEKFDQISDEDYYQLYSKLIEEYYFTTEKNYFRIIYNNANYQTEFKNTLSKIEKKSGKKINFLNLISGLTNISHLEIQKDLNDLSKNLHTFGKDDEKTKKTFNQFIKRHYHHGDAELDITRPRWGEEPDKVWEMAKNNHQYLKESHQNFNLDQIINTKFQDKKFLSMLSICREFLTTREKLREHSTRSYYLVRLYTLELSRRLYQNKVIEGKQDIFFYKISELLDLIKHQKKLSQSLIQKRFYTYNIFKKLNAPNEFGGKVVQLNSQKRANNKQFMGVGSAPGIYQGKVRIITELDQAHLLNQGEVLVTKFTDPGWTPLLSKAGAVITEVGGILSHAAVISREYGIPAILNIQNITQILKDGEEIEVNGDEGILTIIQK